MELGLQGKVAIISGGSRGIGQAVALALAREGVDVAIGARGKQDLDRTAEQIRSQTGRQVLPVVADMSKGDDIKAFVRQTLDKFGKIDILINNAADPLSGNFLKMPDEFWRQGWETKAFGYIRLAREVFSHMQQRRSGRIINIIGNAGKMTVPDYMVGGAVCAALNNFTINLAHDAGPYNILVNAINPGPVRTEMYDRLIERWAEEQGMTAEACHKFICGLTTLGREGTPEEVADLVVFLASERATYIHGAGIIMDGGMSKFI